MTEAAAPATPAPRWTPAQRAAIESRAGNLVVSASAGAGKTTVLTERVLRLITEPGPAGEPPARIDQMLIITFTEKAARQMRERIERRIHQGLAAAPDNPRLLDALDRLGGAWIMTIDAFCRRVVVDHFHRAGLAPNPRVPDETERAQLELAVLDELLEERAAAPGPPRAELEWLLACQPGGARALAAELRELLAFLQSLDRPDLWLRRARERIDAVERAQTFADLPEAAAARAAFADSTAALTRALCDLIDLAGARGGDPACLDAWRWIAHGLDALARREPLQLDAARDWLAQFADGTLDKLQNKTNCGDALYQNEAFRKHTLERFARRYAAWRDKWFALDEAGLLHGARLAARQARALLQLADEARRAIDAALRRRGLATFNDFERIAFDVLCDPATDAPSDIARAYQEQFRYVLVDEYQDTSPLQDALIRRVTRLDDPSPNAEGNLFIVGDYKQSIYRFRHAEPGLFLDKLRAAEREAVPGIRRVVRIDLPDNFRARRPLIEFVNHCFERLMDEQVGELRYADRERLVHGRPDELESGEPAVEVHWLPRAAEPPAPEAAGEEDSSVRAEEELTGVEAQAAWVARRIRELTDPAGALRIPTGDGAWRPAVPGDCAILLRSLKNEIDVWSDALEREGLAVRAPGLSPLFTAPELIDLVHALRAIDNPLQDVPLAALMRSPMFAFSDDDLLRLRLARRKQPFSAAVMDLCADPDAADLPADLRRRLRAFGDTLAAWRRLAWSNTPVELLAAILRDTRYEAWLRGKPDAAERLQRVDYLRDLLARLGHAADGANPLAAFLELLERAESESLELGELPESMVEQHRAVSLLTIHKSKGLEFPIVFLPRLERGFRTARPRELHCDRLHGLALRGVDLAGRRRYGTLALRVMEEAALRQERSEELRLLYVAMTRARERLVLVGQAPDPQSLPEQWGALRQTGGRPLGVLDRLTARSPADLLGPIIEWLRAPDGGGAPPWLTVRLEDELPRRAEKDDALFVREALAHPGPPAARAAACRTAAQRLDELARAPAADNGTPLSPAFVPPHDPLAPLTRVPAKATVTQLRRLRDEAERAAELDRVDRLAAAGEIDWNEASRFIEEEMQRPAFARAGALAARRPAWCDPPTHRPTGAVRGTLTHALLAQLDLTGDLSPDGIRRQARDLAARGRLELAAGADELDGLDYDALGWFFSTEPGRRMRERPLSVRRELPFTAARDATEFSPAAARAGLRETVLLQGIIDVILDDGDAATVLDYKTDWTDGGRRVAELREHYRLQIECYGRALRAVWRLQRVQAALVFLDARAIEWISLDD